MLHLLVAIALLLAMVGCETDPRPFDLVIRGGEVYDGLSEHPQRVDVAITGDRIVSIGDLATARSHAAIDAHGLTVAPGFIDVQARSGATLLADGNGESHIRQGITTEILGDLDSPAFWTTATSEFAALRPFSVTFDWSGANGYFERLQQRGIAMNVATLIPLALAREGSSAIEAAMKGGAIGLSATRGGRPTPMSTDALTNLAHVVAAHDGVLAMWVTGTAEDFLAGIDEAIEIASRAKLPIVIYQPETTELGVLGDAVARISNARARGVDVHTTMTPGDPAEYASRAYWLRDSGASVGSQTPAVQTDGLLGKGANPRAHDTFPHVFTRYVLEGQLSLGQAIRRMTGTAAAQFRLDGRGAIRVGSFADIVIFDPEAFARAGGGAPRQDAMGLHHVIVNGVPVRTPEGPTGARPGRALIGRGRAAAARPIS